MQYLIFLTAALLSTTALSYPWKLKVFNHDTKEIKLYEPTEKEFKIPLPGVDIKCILGKTKSHYPKGYVLYTSFIECGGSSQFFRHHIGCNVPDRHNLNQRQVYGVQASKASYRIDVSCSD